MMRKDVFVIKWTEIKGELSRTYHYPDAGIVTFKNVTRIEVRRSGSHRLETKNGGKAFVPPGWRWLEIDAKGWSL